MRNALAVQQQLKDLAPPKKKKVMLLAQEAGLDTSDWKNYAGGVRRAAANPKYCYEWAFVQQGKVVVLNLWHIDMKVRDEHILLDIPPRATHSGLARKHGKAIWHARSERLDLAIQAACRDGLPVRAIICTGKKRGWTKRTGKPSRVTGRDLDTISWAVTAYDPQTGACTLTRGARPRRLITAGLGSQFDRRERDASVRPTLGASTRQRKRIQGRLDPLDLTQRAIAKAAEAVIAAGQGWATTAEVRSAIALHGMRKAKEWLALHYPRHQVIDASSRRAFDYQCTFGKDRFFVEVKCTSTAGRFVYLSPNEVELVRNLNNNMILLVISDVVVENRSGTMVVSGGIVRPIVRWRIANEDLQPALFRYRIPE